MGHGLLKDVCGARPAPRSCQEGEGRPDRGGACGSVTASRYPPVCAGRGGHSGLPRPESSSTKGQRRGTAHGPVRVGGHAMCQVRGRAPHEDTQLSVPLPLTANRRAQCPMNRGPCVQHWLLTRFPRGWCWAGAWRSGSCERTASGGRTVLPRLQAGHGRARAERLGLGPTAAPGELRTVSAAPCGGLPAWGGQVLGSSVPSAWSLVPGVTAPGAFASLARGRVRSRLGSGC